MIITNEVKLQSGAMATGLILDIRANTNYLLGSGKVYIDFDFYTSQSNKENGFKNVYPAIVDGEGKYLNAIDCCTLDIPLNERQSFDAIEAYTKVKTYLEQTYSWTVTL